MSVLFGIDRLLADPALRAPLAGKRVALVAHPASVTADLTHSLDALIAEGVNVRTMSEDAFDTLYRTWLECNVLVVRGQNLQLGEFLAYSRRFGQIDPHPSKSTRHPDCPEITLLGVNKFNLP